MPTACSSPYTGNHRSHVPPLKELGTARRQDLSLELSGIGCESQSKSMGSEQLQPSGPGQGPWGLQRRKYRVSQTSGTREAEVRRLSEGTGKKLWPVPVVAGT